MVLEDSEAVGGKFSVVQGGYNPGRTRNQQVKRTVAGTLDISQGVNVQDHQYLIRCKADETRSGFGNYAELIRLWSLNNPKGTPTDRITLTDHYGDTYYVYFAGQFNPQAVTTMLEGYNAIFFVPVTLHFEP